MRYRAICSILIFMKLTLQIQLQPDKEQSKKLLATMERFNAACNWLAEKAFEKQTANKITLQKEYYYQIRQDFEMSAQMTAICIRHVGATYSRDKSIKPKFQKHGALPYDSRIMSFKGLDRVSLLTLEGRTLVPFVMGKYQAERFTLAKGQADLVRRKDGKWFLLITVDVPEAPIITSEGFLGVDFGVVNIAVDSDGVTHTSTNTECVRLRMRKVKRSLQRKASKQKVIGKRPKNVRRKLKALASKERRFKANTNHVISKTLVEKAKDTGRGIAVEDLTGIRDGKRFRKNQREKHSKWAFAELRGFLEYKGRIHGVEVIAVDPAYTSQTCSECGHIAKNNRRARGIFECRNCGYFDHADFVAAKNIASVAVVMQREVPALANESHVSPGTSPHYSSALGT